MFHFFILDVPVFLAKLDVLVCQTGLSGFDRQNIYFPCFNCCDPLVICITYYLFIHIFVLPTDAYI
jgi:hypothetical protein